MSTILNEAIAGKNKFYLQFGGQGAPYLKELTGYYKEGKMSRFFETAFAAVDKAVALADGSAALPFPVELKKWLEDETSQPKDEHIAGISLGLIQLAQFAHYENLHIQGFDRSAMLKATLGMSGHSQGLIAASFAALQLVGDAFYEGVDKYTQYLFMMGVRAQEVHPFIFASAEEEAKAEAAGSKAPSPMVAVLGDSHETIEAMVKEINPSLPEDKRIYVSLYNTPNNRILSSFRSSLIAFQEKFKDTLAEKGIKYVYLRTTCPFHCTLMEAIKAPFAKDIEKIGFHYTGKDLKSPVISFSDGKDLRTENELGMRMCDDLMVQPLYWDKAMAPVAENSAISHVIDFGPGKVSQRLSVDTLKGLSNETPVFAAAFAKDLKTLLAT